MNRVTPALVVAAFAVVGVVGWVGGMPKPAAVGADTVPYPVVIGGEADAAASAPSSAGAFAGDGEAVPFSSEYSPVGDEWVDGVGRSAAIPPRVLEAYAAASIAQDTATPACGLGWNTLAAIGSIESGHGTFGGATVDASGALVGDIVGPALDGGEFAAIRDTDGGQLDGDPELDRAVGPMQFIPSTWAAFGIDGNGDEVADPRQIDDAARTAASYLCTVGGDLSTNAGWSAAVRAYNPDDDYVESVRILANQYAESVQSAG